MSGGVFSPRSEISRATDVNDESGAISSRSLTRRQRSPRTPRSGIGRERLKLKALAKFESSRRKPGEIHGSWRNKTEEKLDNGVLDPECRSRDFRDKHTNIGECQPYESERAADVVLGHRHSQAWISRLKMHDLQ